MTEKIFGSLLLALPIITIVAFAWEEGGWNTAAALVAIILLFTVAPMVGAWLLSR